MKLKKTDKVRFLGIIIDDQLNWEHHIEYLQEKLNSSIITLKRIKKCIPKIHYKKLYYSLFVSHLTYGITAWGGIPNNRFEKIFAIQKRCIRLLFGDKLSFDHAEFYETCARARTYEQHISPKNFVLEHTKPLFNKLSLLTVQNLHKFHTFNEVFKILKYNCPISLFSILQKNKSSHHNLLVVPKYTLNYSRRQFIFKGAIIWNALNRKVLNSPELDHKINIVIPGSCVNSDLSASICFIKNQLKRSLLHILNKGDPTDWSSSNFQL